MTKYDQSNFESRSSDNMESKAEKRRVEERKRKSYKKENRGAQNVKVGLLKRRGAEPSGQMRNENLHATVARSTFSSQNVQNTPLPDNFWKFGCRKIARCCGARFEVKMLKA